MSGRLDLHFFSNLYPDLLQGYSPNNFSQETRAANTNPLGWQNYSIGHLESCHYKTF